MEWLWILIAVVVIMIIGYWLAERAKDDEHVAAAASAREVSETESALITPDPQAASDDLRKIEGIGPKIAELMNDGGIRTYAGLAASPVERVQAILDAAGERYRVHNPASWPMQAGLAAEGKWAELEELQDRLDGGKLE